MSTTGIRRTRNPPLLRSFRQVAAPCLLVVLIGAFCIAQKRSVPGVVNQGFNGGTVVRRNDIANSRAYVRYRIPARGDRYWLSSIAGRFRVAGGWRKIAELTLRESGKPATDKDINEAQFRLEAGQVVVIPL